MEADLVARADPDEPVRSLTNGHISAVRNDATLDAVVEVFATEHVGWVPVLDAERRIVGIVGTADLIGAYRYSLAGSLRSLRSISSGSILVEAVVRADSPVTGRTIADTGWPNGAVVVAIQRGEQLIFPEPSTVIRQEDVLSALVPRAVENRFREVLGNDQLSEATEDQPMF